jgi:peptidoglycan/LPS O-acetylase OafA/YrhL
LEKKEVHIDYLDGLRGLAILLVLAAHFFGNYYLCQFGWTGVNLFFLLSGYLITGRLYDGEKTAANDYSYFRNFYGRRVLRIFPLYYGCLFVFFVVLPVVYSRYGLHFSGLYQAQWWYWAYLSNWNFYLHGYPDNIILITFWSLAVEEQFYLVWPFLFYYLPQAGRVKVICFIWLLSLALRMTSANPVLSYFSTLTAAEPLLLGALLCVLEKQERLGLIRRLVAPALLLGVLVLGAVFVLNDNLANWNPLLMRYGYSGIDLLLAGLLYGVLAGRWRSFWREVFSAGWLCWLGRYSYGIYMFHWFILQMFMTEVQSLWLRAGGHPDMVYWVVRAAGTLLVLLCAFLSYRFYERPFLRLKKYFA